MRRLLERDLTIYALIGSSKHVPIIAFLNLQNQVFSLIVSPVEPPRPLNP
jgi:hypothetical protein